MVAELGSKGLRVVSRIAWDIGRFVGFVEPLKDEPEYLAAAANDHGAISLSIVDLDLTCLWNAICPRRNTVEALIFCHHRLFIFWIEGIRLMRLRNSPHLVSDFAVNTVTPDKYIATHGSTILADHDHFFRIVIDLGDSLRHLDLRLVCKVLVEDSQHLLALEERRRICEPGQYNQWGVFRDSVTLYSIPCLGQLDSIARVHQVPFSIAAVMKTNANDLVLNLIEAA